MEDEMKIEDIEQETRELETLDEIMKDDFRKAISEGSNHSENVKMLESVRAQVAGVIGEEKLVEFDKKLEILGQDQESKVAAHPSKRFEGNTKLTWKTSSVIMRTRFRSATRKISRFSP